MTLSPFRCDLPRITLRERENSHAIPFLEVVVFGGGSKDAVDAS